MHPWIHTIDRAVEQFRSEATPDEIAELENARRAAGFNSGEWYRGTAEVLERFLSSHPTSAETRDAIGNALRVIEKIQQSAT